MQIVAIDDDAADLELVRRSLKPYPDVRLVTIASFEDACAVVPQTEVDCILLDLMLPGLERFEGIRTLREISPGVPIVLLTSTDDIEVYVDAIEAGADDCICKDEINGRQLYRSVRNTVQRHRLQRELEVAARTDSLTGLPNRAAMVSFLDSLREQVAPEPIALVLMDIDDFKLVNDSHGHDIGDKFLVHFAERLQQCASQHPRSMTCRLGGDEFVVLLRGEDPHKQVNQFTRCLRRALKSPMNIDGLELFAGVSTGAVNSQNGCDYQELLREADMAMFASKSRGKARHSWFDAPMREQSRQRLALEGAVRRAVDGREFYLQYQPKVEIETGRVVGFEALARWSPEDSAISPARFIPVAERTGAIHRLGAWALREVCRQLKRWDQEGLETNIAVNVSPVQLDNPRFVHSVAEALQEHGVAARRITLEVTESSAVHEVVDATTKLQELREMGVQISIDDFGTGHSSLSQLHQLPVDELKVDRSFVSTVTDACEFSRVFIETIYVLASTLGLKVVAEGIETEQQRQFLLDSGYQLGQGFHFSGPLAAPAATALLASNAVVQHDPAELARW